MDESERIDSENGKSNFDMKHWRLLYTYIHFYILNLIWILAVADSDTAHF